MNTNTNTNQIKKRIFAIACRKNTAIITDSKTMKYDTFTADNSQLACVKALNNLLDRMPKGVKLDYAVAILLPETINFLAYEDTRNYWLANGTKKNGDAIDPQLLAEIRTLHTLLRVQARNIQIFNQKKLKSPLYISYARATWNTMNDIMPRQNIVSCDSF